MGELLQSLAVTRRFRWKILLVATDLNGITNVFADRRASLGLVLGLGLSGTGIACIIYYFIVEQLGAVAASGVTYIPPVVALLICAIWVGEPVRPLHILAMFAILLGVGLLQSGRSVGKAVPKERKRQTR